MDVTVTSSPSRRRVAVNVIHSPEKHACQHWIGLFRRGTMQVGDILACKSTEQAFQLLAQNGLNETQNVMISDVAQTPSKFYHFVPWSEETASIAQDQLSKTVTLWKSETLGAYIDPELFETHQEAFAFLKDTLRHLVQHAACKEIYLMVGTYSRAKLLTEVLLAGNMDRDEESYPLVTIYH